MDPVNQEGINQITLTLRDVSQNTERFTFHLGGYHYYLTETGMDELIQSMNQSWNGLSYKIIDSQKLSRGGSSPISKVRLNTSDSKVWIRSILIDKSELIKFTGVESYDPNLVSKMIHVNGVMTYFPPPLGDFNRVVRSIKLTSDI